MKKLIVICVIFINLCNLCYTQDIHFSQFTDSPLNLNPALTGSIEGEVRGILNYRNQWNGIASPFVTTSVSADMTLLGNKLGEDWVGAGFVVVNDKAGTGNLSYLKLMLSGSYFKWLNKWNYLSWGLQAGVVQRKIDIGKLNFGNQFTDDGYLIAGEPNGEMINGRSSFTNFDMHTGVSWAFIPHEKLKIYSGIGVFHLLRPQNSFLAFQQAGLDKESRLGVLHSNVKIGISRKVDLLPSVLYMRQKQEQEITAGTSLGYNFIKDYKFDQMGTIYIGSWYRFADAVIIMAGVEYQSWKVGISYDVNVSSLRFANKSKGGPEFSLIYEAPIPTKRRRRPIPCPRFD